MSTSRMDDLEAVRVIVEAIKDFPAQDQQRIFRWVAEKLGTPLPALAPPLGALTSTGGTQTSQLPPSTTPPPAGADVKSFMVQKNPRSDVQFAAAAAYYYRFEASQSERKDSITKDDLQDAARKASRERFADPGNTLNNAHKLGLLDKGSEKGSFVINSVGENLVAMTLPDGSGVTKPNKGKQNKKSKTAAKEPMKQAKRRT